MASLLQRTRRKVGRIARKKIMRLRPPLRTVIIGCGEMGLVHAEEYEATGLARVVALSDIRPSALARALDLWPEARAFRDYKQMLAAVKPDIVSICTWPQQHAEMTQAAVAAGARAILCEKPLALTMADVDAMVSTCEKAAIKLAGGHQWRFHPHFAEAAVAIGRGAIGKVSVFRGEIQSTLANNGPHLFDTVRYMLGDPPARQVTCQCQRASTVVNRGYPAEDSASGVIVFEREIRFEFKTGAQASEFFKIEVEGEKGRLEVTPRYLKLDGDVVMSLDPDAAAASCRRLQFREFLRWVAGRWSGYSANGAESAKTAELVLAAYEAARVGASIELPLRAKGDVIRTLYPAATDAAVATVVPSRAAPPNDARLAMDGGTRALPKWFSSRPHIGIAELAGLTGVIASGGLNRGTVAAELEREFARAYDSAHAVTSTSGTAAIHVALAALNLEPCSEVITTPMTDMGTVIPILFSNLVPVFADIAPLTGNLTAETIARRITPRTRAVIVVHLFGRPADLNPIRDVVRQHGIALIEDCSQAHFAEYRNKKVGTVGDLACFSLQQSKQITCGDGGVTLVNREDLVRRAMLFVDKAWNRGAGRRAHEFLGQNYRLTDVQAAIALAQLRKLPDLIRRRRESADRLVSQLKSVAGIVLPTSPADSASSWWKFNFAIDERQIATTPDVFAEALQTEGVQVMRDYLPRPLFDEDVLKHRRTFGTSGYPLTAANYRQPDIADFPGLQEFFRRQLIMSWSSRVAQRHVDRIADAVRKVVSVVGSPPLVTASKRPASELLVADAVH